MPEKRLARTRAAYAAPADVTSVKWVAQMSVARGRIEGAAEALDAVVERYMGGFLSWSDALREMNAINAPLADVTDPSVLYSRAQ